MPGAYPGPTSSPDIVDRLERITREHILGSIPAGQAADLKKAPLHKLLITYGNWRSRFPAPVPRTVRVSGELASRLPTSQHKDAVAALGRIMEKGEPLDPYLSRRVATAHIPANASAKDKKMRADLDRLLADWGVHHLHLGEHHRGAFSARSKDLLFAAFTDADAYLIGVYAHGSWSDIGIAEVIVRNWPTAGLLTEIAGISPTSPDQSAADRAAGQKAGLLGTVTIDGKVYMPPGQTTADTSIDVTLRANDVLNTMTTIRERGFRESMLSVDADPDAHWVPNIREEIIGFESPEGFVAVGSLV